MTKSFDQFHLPEEVPTPRDSIATEGGQTFLKEGEFQSPNFKTGEKGWKVNSEGKAEVQGLVSTSSVIIVKRITGEVYAKNDALYLKKTDSRVYRTVASAQNDALYNFLGFAQEASLAIGESRGVYESSYVPGFTGLTTGSWYFLTNTAGAISTTPGTYYRRVGIAISTTELFVFRDSLRVAQAKGTFSVTDLGSNPATTVVTTGFAPNIIYARCGIKTSTTAPSFADVSSATIFSRVSYFATWYSGIQTGINHDMSGTPGSQTQSTTALLSESGALRGTPSLTITTVTDTGFTIRLANDGTNVDESAYWEIVALA